MWKALFAAAVLAGTLGSAVAQTTAQRGVVAPSGEKTRPITGISNSSDAKIEQDIRGRLAKSKLNAEHFSVSVHAGVATFEGKTNVLQHKGVATRMARSAGAVSIRNNIHISDEARSNAAKNLARPGKGAVERAIVARPESTR